MMRHIGVLFAAMLLNAPATAADACPEKGANAEWAAGCFKTDKGSRRLKPQHLKHLRFDSRGHATLVISEPRELVAVNRQGKVVVPGIRHTGDFDFRDAEGGIARFETSPTAPGSKARPQCGYFDSRSFRIVIPAEYAQCTPFANGEAIVCKDCASVCVEPECQDSILVDGDGVALGPDGNVRRRFRLPDQNTVCAQAGSEEHKAYTGTRPECILTNHNPFK